MYHMAQQVQLTLFPATYFNLLIFDKGGRGWG